MQELLTLKLQYNNLMAEVYFNILFNYWYTYNFKSVYDQNTSQVSLHFCFSSQMTLNSHNLTADKLLNIHELCYVLYKLTLSRKVNFTYLGIEKNLTLFAFIFFTGSASALCSVVPCCPLMGTDAESVSMCKSKTQRLDTALNIPVPLFKGQQIKNPLQSKQDRFQMVSSKDLENKASNYNSNSKNS